jgi:hypothetical protein
MWCSARPIPISCAQGEAYREALRARARKLGVADKVVFENGFVDHDTLLSYISMYDIYVTQYLNASQLTSGTLAYSFGLARAVVSTPYWHAREFLAAGGGVLVPFGDSAATGACRDGLHPDRANENRGGESAVSYLLALVEMQIAARAGDLSVPPPSSPFARMPVYDRSSACPTEVF